MGNLKNKIIDMNGITLIALVITVIVLLILAGVSINMIFGQDGIFNKTQIVVDEYNKAEAEEKAKLKVAEKNMIYYSDYQRKGEVAEIAEKLENDEEVEYVKGGKPIASTDFSNYSTVIFKLKAYVYEFEIGEDLQVAVVNEDNLNDNKFGKNYLIRNGNETSFADGLTFINPNQSVQDMYCSNNGYLYGKATGIYCDNPHSWVAFLSNQKINLNNYSKLIYRIKCNIDSEYYIAFGVITTDSINGISREFNGTFHGITQLEPWHCSNISNYEDIEIDLSSYTNEAYLGLLVCSGYSDLSGEIWISDFWFEE